MSLISAIILLNILQVIFFFILFFFMEVKDGTLDFLHDKMTTFFRMLSAKK